MTLTKKEIELSIKNEVLKLENSIIAKVDEGLEKVYTKMDNSLRDVYVKMDKDKQDRISRMISITALCLTIGGFLMKVFS